MAHRVCIKARWWHRKGTGSNGHVAGLVSWVSMLRRWIRSWRVGCCIWSHSARLLACRDTSSRKCCRCRILTVCWHRYVSTWWLKMLASCCGSSPRTANRGLRYHGSLGYGLCWIWIVLMVCIALGIIRCYLRLLKHMYTGEVMTVKLHNIGSCKHTLWSTTAELWKFRRTLFHIQWLVTSFHVLKQVLMFHSFESTISGAMNDKLFVFMVWS